MRNMSKKIHTDIEIKDIGDSVFCDVCNDYYGPDNPASGGFLFESKAYCPKCAVRLLIGIIKYGEQRYIKEWCPEGMSFHDWVMKLRGGNNTIKIITKEMR